MFVRGYKQTEDHKQKIGKANKGKKRSEEIKQKLSQNLKGHKRSSSRHKKIVREKWLGSKNPRWSGGIRKRGGSKDYYFSDDYKEWRMAVFLRDNFTCQFCELRSHVGLEKSVILEAHHIKFWKNYPSLRFNVNNGITLCRECHQILTKVQRTIRKMTISK